MDVILKKAVFFIFILAVFSANAQKVGLVLSGGGAKGLAHIGAIRALEEKGIPIDYIAGTSIGAIVGGLYAAGYSTEEMEAIFCNPEFDNILTGKMEGDYYFFFKQQEVNSTWLQLKFDMDSAIFLPSLTFNIVSPHQMDFAFMEYFSKSDYSLLMCPISLLVSVKNIQC